MKKLSVRQFPNPCVLSSANQFYYAALLLDKAPLAVPTIVNAAFSLELYLKSLNSDLVFSKGVENQTGITVYKDVKNIPNKFGHNPSELFDALSSNIQSDLNCKYAECFQTKTLRSVLSEYDEVFEKWRYIFSSEVVGLSLADLLSVLKFLHDYSNSQHKTSVEQ